MFVRWGIASEKMVLVVILEDSVVREMKDLNDVSR
jgi:hypothetical protein